MNYDQRNWILIRVRPMAFLTDLATNMTAHDMVVIIYSANDDSVVSHFGSQSRFLSRSLSLQHANVLIQLPSKCDIPHFAHSSRLTSVT